MSRRRHRSRRVRSRDDFDDEREPERPRSTRKRRELTPEERAYRRARNAANRKLSVALHGATFLSALTIILFFTRSFRVVLIVAMSWGIALFLHWFVAVFSIDLRNRWIRREVGRQVERGVSVQKRVLEETHVKSMEDLSASIAHEIRNPISAAKSLVQQMGEDPVAPDNIEYAKVALEELDRVERSISHLLRYAREEELRFEWFSVGELVDSAVETFRDRSEQAGVRIEVEIDPGSEMFGDVEKLRRVLINLVGNALDALEQARVSEPRVQILAGQNLAGSELWIRVRDNGPGIDAASREKIFSPFYTSKSTGTGLGLALSKKVVDAHGGAIELESEPGEGSEFVLTFPKQRPGAGEER